MEKWREHKIDIIVSPAILDEVERVLMENFKTGYEVADNIFLEAAIEGEAEFIVSRDKDLLSFKNFRGIEIISPEDMTNWIRKNVE